ncbi:DUF7537 family lipoprotein [Halobaculum sp. EA56]|uniref:DUF7537 family lipoprotein n=1 Tax=Halobaculum sp. EA56 TaxID=3421648 RepID=UPI003EB93AF4
MTRPSLAVAVVCVVLLAGCGAGGDRGGGRTVNPALAGTPTASPTPTPAPDYPPGVTADGVDVRALTAAHDRALVRRNSTVRFSRTVVAADGTTLATRESVTEHAGDRLGFRLVANGSLPGEPDPALRSFAFWTNGSVTAIRSVNGTGAVSYQVVPGRPATLTGVDDSGEGLVFAAFAGTDARVAGTATVDGEEMTVIRAEHDRLNRSGRPTVRNLTAVAYVTDEGVVRSFELRYTATYGEGDDAVVATTTERFRATVGDTAAAPPDWVDEAIRTGSDGSDEDGDGDGGTGGT